MNGKKDWKVHHETKKRPNHLVDDLDTLEKYFPCQFDFQKVIFSFFDRQQNPLTYALDLMFYSKDFIKGRCWSVSYAVMESLGEWCRWNDVSRLLTQELKAEALKKVLQQSSGSLVDIVCKIFKMEDDYEYFESIAKKLLHEQSYREAYYIIRAINMERNILLEEFAFPMFFLDKDSWLKGILEKHKDLQLQFLKSIDAVCESGQKIQEFIMSLPVSLQVKRHAYEPNRLQKRLNNFVEQFGFELKECPHLYHVRCRSAVNYLFYKRYTEASISAQAWEELSKILIDEDVELLREILIKLVCANDSRTAVKLARDFGLNEEDWPEILSTSDEIEFNESVIDDFALENYEHCLNFRLSYCDIHFIDTVDAYLLAIADISENYDIVGIDAEWRPSLGVSREKLSILQLAVWDSVYLLDIFELQRCLNQEQWEEMLNKIFFNKNILKLGYGLQADLQKLMKLVTSEKNLSKKSSHVVDLGTFFKQVKVLYPEVMAGFEEGQESEESAGFSFSHDSKGLSQLCCTVLGKPLNKCEQFSDWERRPLRPTQQIYAALDAFCLLLIYEKLFHILRKQHLTFEEVSKTCSSGGLPKEKKVKKRKSAVKVNHLPIAVSDFKVVTDNMAQGLGRYLRMCGADVVFLTNDDDHMQAVQIALAENRVILTSGRPYEKLSGYVPEDKIFNVSFADTAKEQAAKVLKHFNVQCKESDLFSRCSVCNGKEYQNIISDELQELWSRHILGQTTQECESESDATLASGVPIQLASLSPQVFERVKTFFVCVNCGKVYWEGSHYSRLKERMSEFIEIEKSPKGTVYQVLDSGLQEKLPLSASNDPGSSDYSSSTRTIMHFDEDSSDEEEMVFC